MVIVPLCQAYIVSFDIAMFSRFYISGIEVSQSVRKCAAYSCILLLIGKLNR